MSTATKENGQIQRTERQDKPLVHDSSTFGNFLDSARFDHLWRVATCFSKSDLVPEQFRGKPENCMIGLQMALRCRVDPFMFLQNCYVVHGRPGVESKLAIAMLNASGQIRGRMRFNLEGEGAKRKCTALVTDANTGEIYSQTLEWKTVEAEGWVSKQGSKWKTLGDLMLQYRSAMFLIRLYYPDVLMGLQTVEEIQDVGRSIARTEPQPSVAARLLDRMGAEKPEAQSFTVPMSPNQVALGGMTTVAEVLLSAKGDEDPPEELWADAEKECCRTGTFNLALEALAKAAGAPRYAKCNRQQLEAVIAEMKDMPTAKENPDGD